MPEVPGRARDQRSRLTSYGFGRQVKRQELDGIARAPRGVNDVSAPAGDVVLSADACYLRQTLERTQLPGGAIYDRKEMLASLDVLRKLQRAGARIFYGHDPEFWAGVPQAPAEIL